MIACELLIAVEALGLDGKIVSLPSRSTTQKSAHAPRLGNALADKARNRLDEVVNSRASQLPLSSAPQAWNYFAKDVAVTLVNFLPGRGIAPLSLHMIDTIQLACGALSSTLKDPNGL